MAIQPIRTVICPTRKSDSTTKTNSALWMKLHNAHDGWIELNCNSTTSSTPTSRPMSGKVLQLVPVLHPSGSISPAFGHQSCWGIALQQSVLAPKPKRWNWSGWARRSPCIQVSKDTTRQTDQEKCQHVTSVPAYTSDLSQKASGYLSR